ALRGHCLDFYMYCPPYDRHLLSFPTRRSSDLQMRSKIAGRSCPLPDQTWSIDRRTVAVRPEFVQQRKLGRARDRHHGAGPNCTRSEEHTSELQSRFDLVCRLLLEK